MKKLVFILLAALSLMDLGAQNTFVKGYVITEKGDTVRGDVKLNAKKEIELYTKLTFKDATGAQKMYKPLKTKGYGYEQNHFITMQDSEGEMKFAKVLAVGPISLYKVGFEGLKMNTVVVEFEYYLVSEESNDKELIKENKYKRQLNEWMRDNVSFLEANDDKKFDEQKVIDIINQYNAWKRNK
ncbi:MAG: hypothetical protein JNL60_02970 [Bacteroidia bacterium]|nr:hypothetical protein [Bacteroidia bacterium]